MTIASPYSQSRFTYGQAQPKSSDSQQGPLATPAQQASAKQSAAPAMAQQFGSSQTKGDYSAYSPGGNYQQYSQPSAYPQGGYMNYMQPVGQTVPYQQSAARPPQMTPEEIRAKYPDLEQMPMVIDGPPGDPRRGSFTPNSPTWNDPRNAKARERYNKLLDEYTQYQNPQTNYAGGSPYFDERLGQYEQPYYGTQEANYPGFPSAAPQQPTISSGNTGQWLSQPQVYSLPQMDQGPQFYNQRDAFINNINQSLGQQMMQNFGSAQPLPPQMNYGALWNQAGEMARNGWTNPLAGLFA